MCQGLEWHGPHVFGEGGDWYCCSRENEEVSQDQRSERSWGAGM